MGLAGKEILVYFDQETDPVKNLAREEELFEKVDGGGLQELVRLWVNSECLVRGKAKSNNYGWYDEEAARRMQIPVIERETGGGVVYHDKGNLNWSFFLRSSGAFLSPAKAFDLGSKYVVKALLSLGLHARFSPPNRIDVLDRKVSGMAAKSTTRTLLVHGTLLLHADLEKLNMLCIPPPGCPPVSNLNDWVEEIDPPKVLRSLVCTLIDSGLSVRVVDTLD